VRLGGDTKGLPVDSDPLPVRVLPELTPENEFFWTAGADGVLRILRCADCGYYNHPPYPVCGRCLSRNVAPAPVSGRGTVYSCTVNHQQWMPGTPPYSIAMVALEEQPDVRIFTNIIGCDPGSVAVGDHVEVTFAQHEDVWLPLFRKTAAGE
jgi:uncharacterized OB-fold protein